MRRTCPRLLAVAIAGLVPVSAPAVVIVVVNAPGESPAVVQAAQKDPRVVALRADADALRDRMRRWKKRDFQALFGTTDGRTDHVLMLTEPRMMMLSGIGPPPEQSKAHVADFPLAELGRVEVHFWHDGETPQAVLFRLRAGVGTPPLGTATDLDRRVDWERAAFRKITRHVGDRWRAVVRWEVDPAKAGDSARGLDAPDLPAVLTAVRAWAARPDVRAEQQGSDLRWFRGDREVATLCARESNFDLVLYRPDGTRLWDRDGGPNTYNRRRWYRADETMIRMESGGDGTNGRAAWWGWQNPAGRPVRAEWDTNGDGLPDQFRAGVIRDEGPRDPLSVDQSWAVHPELIPADLRIPDQHARQIAVREIPE